MRKLLIDKKNLIYNLNYIKNRTNAKICAVVKANAYGHGIKEICKPLKNKVDFFAVASLDEALEIRKFDTKTKILIMGKCEDYLIASSNNISVTIFNKTELLKLIKLRHKILNIKIHIKVNTGMNRIGFSKLEDFYFAVNEILKIENFVIEGVFTHFATLRNCIEFFKKQQELFQKYLNLLPANLKFFIHGGGSMLLSHPFNYNLIRSGIYLYGYGLKNLKKVMSIKTTLIHTNEIFEGECVGYSNQFIADKDMKIGVIPIGYYDGIPKNLVGKEVIINDKRTKILSVCMDMTIIEIPQKYNINSIINIEIDAAEWAEYINTNHHDILVGFSTFRGERKLNKYY